MSFQKLPLQRHPIISTSSGESKGIIIANVDCMMFSSSVKCINLKNAESLSMVLMIGFYNFHKWKKKLRRSLPYNKRNIIRNQTIAVIAGSAHSLYSILIGWHTCPGRGGGLFCAGLADRITFPCCKQRQKMFVALCGHTHRNLREFAIPVSACPSSVHWHATKTGRQA